MSESAGEDIDQLDRPPPMTRLRNALALITVIAALLAVTAFFKRETCSCGGPGVSYGTIAAGSVVVAIASLAIYFAMGLSTRRR